MTTQNIIDNKAEIIATITEKVGAENVHGVLEQMVKGLDCCDTMDELIENAIYMATQFEFRAEKSKLAALLGKINEQDEN